MINAFEKLNHEVCRCSLCPRLVHFREEVPSLAKFQFQDHWRKPVPGFGDARAWLLLLGLAPSSQGANRTGRIFTGDASAVFLMNALYKEGFASQSFSQSKEDGLKLKGCYMTASVKCVPPKHRPLKTEILNCSRYLYAELELLTHLKVVLALGKLAFDSYLQYAHQKGRLIKRIAFKHGVWVDFEGLPSLVASYHPSPQNTQTGRLTETMFCDLLRRINTFGS